MAERNGRNRLALIFACVIIGAWTVSFLIAIIHPDYNPPRELTPLVFVIAGWLYREALGHKSSAGPKEDEHERHS